MVIEIIPVLGDNYAYLVVCEETRQAAAVDPVDADAVARRIDGLGVQLAAIWCTHHHADHTGGNRELISLCGPCQVVGHVSDGSRIPKLSDGVEDGARLQLGRVTARVLHTPGHTRGSLCYLVEGPAEGADRQALFTGDTLFGAGCGRLFEGDPETMFRSLNEVIRALPLETRVHCGHEYTEKNLDFAWTVEPESAALARRIEAVHEQRAMGAPSVPFTLIEELSTNPFLRCDRAEIVETLRRQHPGRSLDPLGVFTLLRELRNVF